MSTTRF